jgi:hypothetical protein
MEPLPVLCVSDKAWFVPVCVPVPAFIGHKVSNACKLRPFDTCCLRPLLLCALQPYLDEVKAERSERARLGTGAPYQRTIP